MSHTPPVDSKGAKITLKDVARATFWLQFNYDSKCPYCGKKLARDGEFVEWHLREVHPDIAYPAPRKANK